MSIPQLFYFGILVGILTRIPGLDLGCFIFALHLNSEIYQEKLKKTLILVSTIAMGYLVTKLIPLSRLDIIIYHYSDNILGFLSGLFFYSAIYLWLKKSSPYQFKEMVLAIATLIGLIILKALQIKFTDMDSLWISFFQGLSILLPGIYLPVPENITISSAILIIGGILLSLWLLSNLQRKIEQYRPVIVATILASLCDLWPWRAFQSFSYSSSSVRWIKDYPVLPEMDAKNIIIVLIFIIIGVLSSWMITKTYVNRIILVHE